MPKSQPDNAYDLIFNGQYPPLHDSENPQQSFHLQEIYQICALHSGQLLSMDSIARDVGVSSPTIKTWLSILDTSFIIHFLEPDTKTC